MLSARRQGGELLLVSGVSEIIGSVFTDAFVKRDCSLHIRGNLKGNLTIEQGASVIVQGSVDGKVVNRGGRLVVHNKGIAEFVKADGPPEAEAGGILKINLSSLAANWAALAKRTTAECAAVVKADAYGCGIATVAAVLAVSGCKTFFVSNLAEAKRVRAAAQTATIYVLGGLLAGTAPVYADINVRPVINSLVELSAWDVFVDASGWTGGCALNVDTGTSRFGISAQEGAPIAARVRSSTHGIALLMSSFDNTEKPDQAVDRQIKLFQDLRRLFVGIPASLANSSGIFIGAKTHCDLVRPGAALYGINPTPGAPNPMQAAIELRGRIMQVRKVAAGETIGHDAGWTAKRPARLALVAVGYADGYPRAGGADGKMQAIVGGKPCPVAGNPAMDWLAVDITHLPDTAAARPGDMVTLIGGDIGIDDLAAAARITGREVLSRLGRRFHRLYYVD